MTTKLKIWRSAAVAAAVFLAMLSAADALAQCEAEIAEALEQSKIPQSDVKSVTVNAERAGGDSPRVDGYTAWVARQSCSGNFVVNLSTSCRVKNTYATGDCKGK